MQEVYSKAFFGEPPTAFGVRLLPFSLGHSFLLEAIGNAVALFEPHSVQDCAAFAWICSMPYDEAVRRLCDRKAVEDFGRSCVGMDMESEAAKVIQYRDDAFTFPRRWQQDGERAAKCKIPWQLAYFETLSGGAAITPQLERELWNMPLARAICYCTARANANPLSSLDVMSEEEERAIEILKEADNGGS